MNEVEPQSKTPIQLSLRDLFIGTAAIAVVLWLNRWVNSPRSLSLSMFVSLTISLTQATGVWACCYFAWRWWRKVPTDFQPGHWLLCLLGFLFVLLAIEQRLQSWLFVSFDTVTEEVLTTMSYPFLVVVLRHLLFLAVGLILPVRWPWRFLLLSPLLEMAATAYLFYALQSMTASSSLPEISRFASTMRSAELAMQVGAGLSVLLLIALAIWDRWTAPTSRDWLHWIGCVMMFLYFTLTLFVRLRLFGG
ncbi:hypothetical protein [Blastopirellula marina]|uniref:Uncharacterized protein n=1 Tax=Blastopirellula marina TaxID=124 RepID=A0A2S8FLG6_9BACT|nr:hypothetical protein [Blastopirellula marina]PQO33001.1 hypothetical protein C5Y98_17855 [Blastopirellula marina]PTL43168.1 hypothetical protein C5Y97_17865 [Blastopirellula marina]